MKLKSISLFVFTIVLALFSTFEGVSQKRGTTTRKSTSSTSRTTTPAPTFTKDELMNHTFCGWMDMEKDPDKGLVYFDLNLKPEGFRWYLYEDAIWNGNWSVVGNKLNVKSTQMTSLELSSKNGGKSFTGTFFNSYINRNCPVIMYDITRTEGDNFNPNSVIQMLKEGKYISYLDFYAGESETEVGIPVKVSFTFDEDNDKTGYFKVTGTSQMLAAAGVLKFPFSFEDEKFLYSQQDGTEMSLDYSKWGNNYFFLKIGKIRVPKIGNSTMLLYFIKTP